MGGSQAAAVFIESGRMGDGGANEVNGGSEAGGSAGKQDS